MFSRNRTIGRSPDLSARLQLEVLEDRTALSTTTDLGGLTFTGSTALVSTAAVASTAPKIVSAVAKGPTTTSMTSIGA